VKVTEPGADLGLALALASALTGEALPADLVVCGEVGLGGELRQVSQCERRVMEAARLGFSRALVPRLSPSMPDHIDLIRVDTLAEAVAAAGLRRADGDGSVPAARGGRPRLRPVAAQDIPDRVPDELFDDAGGGPDPF
jgi:DNA repair protein RadA/Sms